MKQRYQIDYLEFPSTSTQDSHRFFAEAFGWSFTSYGPSYESINDAGIDAGIDGGVDQHENRVAATMAVVRTDNLDDAERRVAAAGGTITRPQFDFPGGRRFHFREPGGNEMAVYVATE